MKNKIELKKMIFKSFQKLKLGKKVLVFNIMILKLILGNQLKRFCNSKKTK